MRLRTRPPLLTDLLTYLLGRARWAPVPERNKKIGKIRRKIFLNS